MALRFRQQPLPDGLLSIICDDGRNIVHCFAENAPWRVVRRAMEQCANAYAASQVAADESGSDEMV